MSELSYIITPHTPTSHTFLSLPLISHFITRDSMEASNRGRKRNKVKKKKKCWIEG